MSYSELLRDPRWQRKRLEVMQRADFKCEECGDASTTLNVHHVQYVAGRKPWEYEASELRCLCERCHGKEHGIAPEYSAPPRHERVDDPDIAELLAYLQDADARFIATKPGDARDTILYEKVALSEELRDAYRKNWRAKGWVR